MSYPYTHKYPPLMCAIILPTIPPACDMPIRRDLSSGGAQNTLKNSIQSKFQKPIIISKIKYHRALIPGMKKEFAIPLRNLTANRDAKWLAAATGTSMVMSEPKNIPIKSIILLPNFCAKTPAKI
jgi:hypothetical protein